MPQPLSMVSSVPEILTYARSLKSHDKFVEAQVKETGTKATWSWVGFAVSVILVIALGNSGAPALVILPILTGIPTLVLGIVFSSQKAKWSKENMEDRRLELVTQLFSVLGRDIPRRAKCAVNVSFDDYRTHGTQVSLDKSGWFGSLKRSKFEDAWFTARGMLYDGNRFKITITQNVHRKEKSKRKYTKINERFQEEVTLLLKVSPESYPNIANLAPALQATVFDGLQVTRMLADGNLVRITCATPPATRLQGRYGTNTEGWDNLATGHTVLKLFLAVYGKLQECRATQAA
ncbi:MAG: hypothetical protein ACYDCO_16110 [Armatimonadota bacterium]